jgi:uncharacterized protein YbjT (DUF2867 family)
LILVVGASGKLGGDVARRLLALGIPVRAISREPGRLAALRGLGAEVLQGDLTDPPSLARACLGVEKVLAAAHAFTGSGANAMLRVDGVGNRALIDAAGAAGVSHFVFTSAGTGPDDPVDFFRVKYGVEQYLRASGLPFTILRPAAFMEDHAERIGRPVMQQGWTVVFGRGEGLVNYVAAGDVAQVATMALRDAPGNDIVRIAGPENLSAIEVVRTYERVAGRKARVYHVPERMLRFVARGAGPLLPVVRRIVDAGLFMESGHQQMDTRDTIARYSIPPTRLEEFVRQRYAAGPMPQ